MQVLVSGVSLKGGPSDAHALALAPDELPGAHASLRRVAGVTELVILSTCNRVELYAVADGDIAAAQAGLVQELARLKGTAPLARGEGSYSLSGRSAAMHLFRVAAGLDSLVLGEREILGQVRQALTLAKEHHSAGPIIEHLFTAAIHAARRAHAESDIGAGSCSVASTTADFAAQVVAKLEQRTVLIVGAGSTASQVARRLFERGARRFVIANRTPDRALALATAVGGVSRPLDAMDTCMVEADVVVTATSSSGYMIDATTVARAMEQRPERALVLFDLAAPSDVEPAVARVNGVELFPIYRLREIADEQLDRRRAAVPTVEALLAEEYERFAEWLSGAEAKPVIVALRDHFESVRAAEVERCSSQLSGAERSHVEIVTKSIINKLLHSPTVKLKSKNARPEQRRRTLETAAELFSLPTSTPRASDNAE